MTEVWGPKRWAGRANAILKAALGPDRFPVDVPLVARELSRALFPSDPVTHVIGESLPGFEGALYPPLAGTRGWVIVYNSDILSPGRVNFTLAHELGHYFVHRRALPNGLRCSTEKTAGWDSLESRIEREANQFAAHLLMPLDDFRLQIAEAAKPGFDGLSLIAGRYNVSLLAAGLQWLSYTRQRALIVVSREGYLLWSWSSESARRAGNIIRTSGAPVELPSDSVAANPESKDLARVPVFHEGGVWFAEPVEEQAIFSDNYDFVISLLLLEEVMEVEGDEEAETDVFDRFMSHRG
jgi:hypothetical protein